MVNVGIRSYTMDNPKVFFLLTLMVSLGYGVKEEECNECLAGCSTCGNGTCVEPGVCKCEPNYFNPENNNSTCPLTCLGTCGANSYCEAPNQHCKCHPGYYKESQCAIHCTASCTPDCKNADCIAPDECQCRKGYSKNPYKAHECLPVCAQECVNGVCTHLNRCTCLWGFDPAKNCSSRNVPLDECFLNGKITEKSKVMFFRTPEIRFRTKRCKLLRSFLKNNNGVEIKMSCSVVDLLKADTSVKIACELISVDIKPYLPSFLSSDRKEVIYRGDDTSVDKPLMGSTCFGNALSPKNPKPCVVPSSDYKYKVKVNDTCFITTEKITVDHFHVRRHRPACICSENHFNSTCSTVFEVKFRQCNCCEEDD